MLPAWPFCCPQTTSPERAHPPVWGGRPCCTTWQSEKRRAHAAPIGPGLSLEATTRPPKPVGQRRGPGPPGLAKPWPRPLEHGEAPPQTPPKHPASGFLWTSILQGRATRLVLVVIWPMPPHDWVQWTPQTCAHPGTTRPPNHASGRDVPFAWTASTGPVPAIPGRPHATPFRKSDLSESSGLAPMLRCGLQASIANLHDGPKAIQPKSWGGPWCMSIWPATSFPSKRPCLQAPRIARTRTVESPRNACSGLGVVPHLPLAPSPTVATKVVFQANAAWPRPGLRHAWPFQQPKACREVRHALPPPRPKPSCNGPVPPPDSRCAAPPPARRTTILKDPFGPQQPRRT